MDVPKSKVEARAAGAATYVTGKACVWGHVAPRKTSNGHCTVCDQARYSRDKCKVTSRKQINKLRRMFAHRWAKTNAGRRFSGFPNPLRAAPEDNVCECCGKMEIKRNLALDHCHVTQAFRGWLCNSCNTGIGKLGDNEQGLRKALDYLSRARLAADTPV